MVRAVRLDNERRITVADVDVPEPGPDEVVVDLVRAGVNPLDGYVAAGRVAPDAPLPRTLGVEGAGTVDGRPVVVHGSGLGLTRDGAWTARQVVPRDSVVPLPPGIELDQAAALGVVGATAYRVVRTLGEVKPADRVLVLAAAGGVGSLAVSMSKAVGATVLGQVGSAGKRDFVTGRGADDVVVGAPDDVADAVRAFEPTIVIDGLAGGFAPLTVSALAPRGRIVVYGTTAGPEVTINLQELYRKSCRILGYGGMGATPADMRDAVEKAAEMLRDDRIPIPIAEVLPLGEAERALQLLHDRAVTGKVLLDVTT
jgi:NADPH:quinone reductase